MWELDHKEGWALKNWCFWAVVLEKTLESPLACKEIQPVNPKGNQSWIFIGRNDAEFESPILWSPIKNNLNIGKDPCARKYWRHEEKGMTVDEMVGSHHQLPELTYVHQSVMPSNHLILCHPLLLMPSIFPSIRVFSKESILPIRWPKYWSFSFSINPSNEYSGLIFL